MKEEFNLSPEVLEKFSKALISGGEAGKNLSELLNKNPLKRAEIIEGVKRIQKGGINLK